VRVTDELRAEIEELATKENRSLSSWIETTLKRVVEETKRRK
jgi:predicted HicB family RNase H-like nuclease